MLNFLKRHWPELLLFASIVFFLRELLFFGKIFVSPDYGLGDLTKGFIPLAYYLNEALKAGRIPLWLPEIFSGFPYVADGEGGFFYPLNLLLHYFFPFITALNIYTFLTFLIMGFSTFYFLRNLKLSKEAALVGSLSFIFAGGMVARITHLLFLNSVAFLPLNFFLTQKFFQKRNPLYLLLIGIFLSFQILNFSPPTTLVCFIGLGLFFLFKTLTNSSNSKELLTNLAALFFVFILAGALSAIQIVPTLEVISLSRRGGGIGEGEAKEFAFHLEELLYFLRPTPFGNFSQGTYQAPREGFVFFWENNAYIGILGFILGALAILKIFARSQKMILFFAFLLLFSILLALGQFTSYFFILRLPPFSFFRVPGRYLFLSMFSLSTLAAFGFENVTSRFSQKRSLLGILAAIFILADLFSFGLFYNPTYDGQKWLSPPQSAQFLKDDSSFFRVFDYGQYEAFFAVHEKGGWRKDIEPYFNLREGLPPDFNIIFHIPSINGWVGFERKRDLAWQKLLNENILVNQKAWVIKPKSTAIKLLRGQNVKYVVTPFKIEGDDFVLRKEISFETGQASYYVFELKNPLPHAFLVHGVKTTSEDQTLSEFARPEFDPQKEVILEETVENLLDKTNRDSDQVEIKEYLPEKVVIKTQSGSPTFLVLTDSYFPAWEAKIDGQPTKIYQADYLFRAVRLDSGEHRVEFEYKPNGLYLGAVITFSTLLLMIIFALYWIAKGVRKPKS